MSQTPHASTAVEVVDRLLRTAQERGASDLHLDPNEDAIQVRIRRDGVLQELERLPGALHARVVGRLKALSDLLVYRADVPQEGRIPAARSGLPTDVRVATYPTVCGERVAIRLDAPDTKLGRLEDLGLEGSVWKSLRDAIEQPDGVVLVTGPSGSGKTTTLYACLRHLAASTHNPRSIVTIEDPIERRIPGIVQTQVDPVAGLDFSRALRSLLRQDPEVLLVGEIRDRETAKIALEAGLTGHLVVTTVHAGTAPLVFARLVEMGIEPFVLTTAIRGVLAQRLVRGVCTEPKCMHLGEECPRCGGSGYAGRVPLAEWVPMTSELRTAVLRRSDGEALTEAAYGDGFRSLYESGDAAVAARRTTSEEVRRVLGTA
ncbi:MAG: type II/IV secretion system protein [Planctomycetes bacterium]|nr:type II/IV secretion system protein [Planctomycetota bacterium]